MFLCLLYRCSTVIPFEFVYIHSLKRNIQTDLSTAFLPESLTKLLLHIKTQPSEHLTQINMQGCSFIAVEIEQAFRDFLFVRPLLSSVSVIAVISFIDRCIQGWFIFILTMFLGLSAQSSHFVSYYSSSVSLSSLFALSYQYASHSPQV